MTRVQTRRFEKEVKKEAERQAEWERRIEAQERKEQKEQTKASVNVSKSLIAAGVNDDMDRGTVPNTSREIFAREPRRRGVIYLRVSSEAQDGEDRVSLDEQRGACYEYCESQNIEVVAVFCDIAPGRTKDRPDFQRMLAEIRKGNIDVVVCWKGDRLARSVSPANALLEALEGTDTQLEAVRERIDRQFFVLMAWFGGMELDNFRDRSTMGKRGRAKGGKIPCRQICFGYDVDEDGYAVIDEEAAKTICYIYGLYIEEGLGMVKIAKRLNLEGVPTAKGAQWSYSVVNRILSDSTYMGTWHYGKQRWEYLGKKKVRKTDLSEESWIAIEVPQIIDEITWQRAQQLKKERSTHSKRNTKVFFLLQHRMYCEPCGRMMGCKTERRRKVTVNGKVQRVRSDNPEDYYRAYLCYGQQRDGYKCRKPGNIPAQALEDAVWSATERITGNPQGILSILESKSIDDDKRNLLHEEIRRVKRTLVKENEAKTFVIRIGSLGRLTEEELNEQLEIIRERVEHNEELLADLLEQENMARMQEDQKEHIKAFLSSIDQVLGDLSDTQRRELIRLLYTRISIDDQNRITLTVALPGDPSTAISI